MKKDSENPKVSVRRDGAGHLADRVAADLWARGHHEGEGPEEDDRALFRPARTDDPRSEQLGEAFIAGATSGEEASDATREDVDSEKKGGTFVETSEDDLADGSSSNWASATRASFPRS